MWIILIKKLPVKPSPPKLSIFWSEPWIDREKSLDQFEILYGKRSERGRIIREGTEGTMDESFYLDDNGNRLPPDLLEKKMIYHMQVNVPGKILDDIGWGFEHNYARARMILYKGNQIRVFDDEYNPVTQNNMSMYIGVSGEDQSHDLVPEGTASTKIVEEVLKGSLKDIYDAALVEGCDTAQAMAVALGIEIENPSDSNSLATFPAIGWYRCRPEYALIYCDEWEIAEDEEEVTNDQ